MECQLTLTTFSVEKDKGICRGNAIIYMGQANTASTLGAASMTGIMSKIYPRQKGAQDANFSRS
jgi:hypothetical protein